MNIPAPSFAATIRNAESRERVTVSEHGIWDLANTIANRFDLIEQREELLEQLKDKFAFIDKADVPSYMFSFHGHYICALGFDHE